MPLGNNGDVFYRRISLRRAEVLSLLEQNFSQPEIASQLDISLSTVHTHIRELEELTGAANMGELGRFWTAHKQPWLKYIARRAGIEDAS